MSNHTLEVTEATWETEVVTASKQVPVLVDFWAPWCGPCRALGPVLEKLAGDYGGRFRLAKVNSDEQMALAAHCNVRSIPDVRAFRGGHQVSQFTGALPERQVRAFIDALLPTPAELERLRAAELAAAGRTGEAISALRTALTLDAKHDVTHIDLAALLISAGQLEEAEALLKAVRDISHEARVETLRAQLRFARSAAGPDEAALAARLAADPADHAARLALAERHAAAGRYADAMDTLLEIVRHTRDWNGGAARKQMLAIFNLAADRPELVTEYRRRLAAALY